MAMIIKPEFEPEIQEMIDILRSSDAVESSPKFGPTLYGSNDLYDLPVSYVVRIDFEKFARALWDHGYRLVKGEEDGWTGHEN